LKITKLAVLFLLATGVARAESFTYTVSFVSIPTFDPTFNLNTTFSFNVPKLLGDSEINIDPKRVTVEQSPIATEPLKHANFTLSGDQYTFGPERLVSLIASDGVIQANFSQVVDNPHACLTPDCSQFLHDGHWQRDDNYTMSFGVPVTGVGTFLPVHTELTDHTFGDYPLGESFTDYTNHNDLNGLDSLTVVDPPGLATPEPNTGLMMLGASLLGVWLWKRS
jgi:PEP-CTERM motif